MSNDLASAFIAALRSNDRRKARQTAAAMLQGGLRLGRQWRAVANAMLKDGEFALARRAATLLAEQIATPEGKFEAAAIQAQAGRPDHAAEMLQQIPAHVPDPAANAYMRGTLATNLGHLDEARDFLRRAVDLAPRSGQAWLALVMAGGLDEEYGTRLAELERSFAELSGEDRACYLVALGRWHERCGNRTAAVGAYTASGEILQGARPYSFAQDQTEVEAVIRGWDRGQLAASERGRAEEAGSQPIFVTGLPRSGTTLVEQILASHGLVAGGGEMELLRQCAREAGARNMGQVSECLRKPAELPRLADYYRRLSAERFGSGIVVDKSLSTTRYAGLAAMMFPTARFVWLVRDPRDCAWSAFRSYFVAGATWSNSLADIGRHFALEDRLRTFWSEQLGDRMLVLPYADLVTQPEKVIGEIASHCRLDAEPGMYEPHRTKRVVITNSAAQVREPINPSAMGASAAYGDFLAPFEGAYRKTGSELRF